MARIGDPGFLRKLVGLIQTRDPINLPEIVDERLFLAITIPGEQVLSAIIPHKVEIAAGNPVINSFASSDLWMHAGSFTSPAGGAGQFSGGGYTYQGESAAWDGTRLQIVGIRLRPSVDAILRLYYEDVTFFGGEEDLGNLATSLRSIIDLAPGFGGLGWLFQTNTPDTSNIANHANRATRVLVRKLLANEWWEWPGGIGYNAALWNRLAAGGLTTLAMGWGLWAEALVTGITVHYQVIVRKIP